MARLFLPWLPYIMLYICYWLHKLVSVFIANKRIILVVFIVLWAVLVVYHRMDFSESLLVSEKIDSSKSLLVSAQQEVSTYREVHDVLKGKYGDDKRVLMTPLALRDVKDMLQKKPYFDSAGRYLSRSEYSSLDMTIRGYRVKYVIIFKAKLNTNKIKRDDFHVLVKKYYKLERHEYSIRREIAILKDYVRRRGARLIYESKRASIYEFPGMTPMSPEGG
jgi:hypothetical protein